LAKALNAKATVITVTEPLPIDYGSGHASGWIPTKAEVESFDAACKERAGKAFLSGAAFAQNTGPAPQTGMEQPGMTNGAKPNGAMDTTGMSPTKGNMKREKDVHRERKMTKSSRE
jgi:hypothetical protein